MNSYTESLIKEAIDKRKFNVLSEASKIVNTGCGDIVFEQYTGSGVRVFKNKEGNVSVLCPEEISISESEYLQHAIATGSIFDDADRVASAADYTIRTTLPMDAITRQDIPFNTEPLQPVVAATIGRVNDDACVGCDDTDLRNGYAIMKDVITGGSSGNSVNGIVKNYLDVKDDDTLPLTIGRDLYDAKAALDELKNFDDDDILPDDDLIDCEVGDDEELDDDDDDIEVPVEEGFFSKKPKKLKPIPARDIVAYITVEMNAIQDTNDQAMLSGYTCSKLEVADFYLTCIDTNDDRYIVPHSRQFIVQYQNDLNRLLAQILKLKPINRNDRVWKVDVNYPSKYQG